jgi:hypothetical protein
MPDGVFQHLAIAMWQELVDQVNTKKQWIIASAIRHVLSRSYFAVQTSALVPLVGLRLFDGADPLCPQPRP